MKWTLVFVRALSYLPLGAIRSLGWVLGMVLYGLAQSRRHVLLTNLGLCFEQMPLRERRALARRSCILFTQALLDRAWLWHAPLEVVRSRLSLTGAIEELTRPGAVLIFAPHFYGMDAGGTTIMQQVPRKGATLYAAQSNPVFDAWMHAGRVRFGDVTAIARSQGPKPIVRALREGRMLYLLPDMDLGEKESIFVPFFGVQAATVPSLARFAKLGHARVVPVVTRLTPKGYEARVFPAWQNYPSNDIKADTLRMNQELEGYIATMPEQYYWVHKRFKTRPPDQHSLYE